MSAAGSSRILKENVYKRVELQTLADGSRRVVKTFQGHGAADLRRNARTTYHALEVFGELFSGVVRFPRPYSLDEERFTVAMEFLGGLEGSRPLGLRLLPRARPFFSICYGEGEWDFLPGLEESVLATPKVKELIASGFPMRLGFKGDLPANLLWSPEGLCMADVETACREPLGLSETCLLLHAWTARLPLPGGRRHLAKPVAFDSLSAAERGALFRAAIEFWGNGYLSGLSGLRRRSKLRRGTRLLERFLA